MNLIITIYSRLLLFNDSNSKLYFFISLRVHLLQVCLLFYSPSVLPFLTDAHLGCYLQEIFGTETKFDMGNLKIT